MRVFGTIALVAVAVGAVCLSNTQPAVAEQVSIQQKLTITTRVTSRLYLVVGSNNQIKEIFSNSNEEPQVVLAMFDHIGGPAVLVDENIKSQYETLRPGLNYSYGTVYKQDQIKVAAGNTSYQNLPEPSFVSTLQNIGIRI